MEDNISLIFKRLAIIQEQRNKELKQALHPFKKGWLGRVVIKAEEEIRLEVATINERYDKFTKQIREELNNKLEQQGYDPYKKENDTNA